MENVSSQQKKLLLLALVSPLVIVLVIFANHFADANDCSSSEPGARCELSQADRPNAKQTSPPMNSYENGKPGNE